jgi:hypothetical protein
MRKHKIETVLLKADSQQLKAKKADPLRRVVGRE